VGLKGEPQVKSSTRHTGIHTGKGRTSYKPQLENSKYNWYQTSRSTYITYTEKHEKTTSCQLNLDRKNITFSPTYQLIKIVVTEM
jgi:hypothetical protein